jgi:hypothetical protein
MSGRQGMCSKGQIAAQHKLKTDGARNEGLRAVVAQSGSGSQRERHGYAAEQPVAAEAVKHCSCDFFQCRSQPR